MHNPSNKSQFITKRRFRPNIIYLVAYILLSAAGCLNENLQRYNDAHQIMPPKDPKEAQDQALGVTYLLGSGKLLDLDGYQCGLFIASKSKASENEEIFMIKHPPKGGWMQLGAQGKPGAQTDVLPVRYDTFEDPRMIKIDRPLLKLLLGETLDQPSDVGQSGCDKEDFLDAIEQDNDRLKVKLFYKTPIEGSPIFTENDLSYSTRFTKKLHQEFNSDHTLIQSTFSIEGSATSPALTNIEKVGFLLVKDKSGLVNWVKNMLEGEVQWGTNAKVAPTKDYITCPAELIDGVLRFESKDGLQNASFRLEDFSTTCCCLKDGTYGRLISLKNIDIESELISEHMQEMLPETAHYKKKTGTSAPTKNNTVDPKNTNNDNDDGEISVISNNNATMLQDEIKDLEGDKSFVQDIADECNATITMLQEKIKALKDKKGLEWAIAKAWNPLTKEAIKMILKVMYTNDIESIQDMAGFTKINPINPNNRILDLSVESRRGSKNKKCRYTKENHQFFLSQTQSIPDSVVEIIQKKLNITKELNINNKNTKKIIKKIIKNAIDTIKSKIGKPELC